MNVGSGSRNCDYKCTDGGGCKVTYVGPPRAGKTQVSIKSYIAPLLHKYNHNWCSKNSYLPNIPGFLFPPKLWWQLQRNSKRVPGLQPGYQLLEHNLDTFIFS